MNLWACGQLSTSPETQTWYRAIQPQFWTTALQTSQTTTFPTRFNEGANAHPQFEILYLAEDHQLALFEAQALLGSCRPDDCGVAAVVEFESHCAAQRAKQAIRRRSKNPIKSSSVRFIKMKDA